MRKSVKIELISESAEWSQQHPSWTTTVLGIRPRIHMDLVLLNSQSFGFKCLQIMLDTQSLIWVLVLIHFSKKMTKSAVVLFSVYSPLSD